MNPVADVLTRARALIEAPERWTKGANARTAEGVEVPVLDPDAVCFCALGATMAARKQGSGTFGDATAARLALLRVVGDCAGVPDFNDAPTTTHADVLALFDRAIAAAEATP